MTKKRYFEHFGGSPISHTNGGTSSDRCIRGRDVRELVHRQLLLLQLQLLRDAGRELLIWTDQPEVSTAAMQFLFRFHAPVSRKTKHQRSLGI